MENLIHASKFKENIIVVLWLLNIIAAVNCLVRTDFNIYFNFLLIGLLNKFHNENPKFLTKLSFQLIVFVFLAELVFFIILCPYWTYNLPSNVYWTSLGTAHTMTLILTIIELLSKVVLAVLFYLHFKKYYPENTDDLLNLNYENAYSSFGSK